MNKTLLLIICDFLLLNLLALTRWEKAEPARPAARPAQTSESAASKDQDLVDVMKLSLEDERAQREQLSQQLQLTSTSLEERERNLQNVSASLEESRQSAEQLSKELQTASQEASVSKERLAQLQRDLEKREAEAARRQEQLTALEAQQKESRQRIESLDVAVKVAEQEKQLLRSAADTLKEQVQAERQERIKVQETTTQLAQGVGQLAEQSTELTKEIRENRPINANVLFNDFLANRVQTLFNLTRTGFFGPTTRQKDSRTVFVTDGKSTYALLHIEDTPFDPLEAGADWEKASAIFVKNGRRTPAAAVSFLAVDPRVVALPVDPAEAQALGVKVYEVALDPFKFPEAVLISNGGAGYGEVPFKLDPGSTSYVRMDNRLVRRLFGTFSPSKGDLVLSKTGELLGIMVNSDYCAVVNNFLPLATIQTGEDIKAQQTSRALDTVTARYRRLPLKMQ